MSEAPKLDSPEKVRDWLMGNWPGTWEASLAERNSAEWKEPDVWWRLREQVRNREGGRIVPAWWIDLVSKDCDENWDPHYLYVSQLDPKRIAYTPTLEYGRADRQIVTTPGKYLMKHFPMLSAEQMRKYQEWHRLGHVAQEVLFVFDPAEIQFVYEMGPRSCMSYEALGQNHEHPVRIYDGPDTVLAVLAKGDGGFSARALCRIDTTPMTYLRIYGDENVMRARLSTLGFEQSDNPAGARLRLALAHPDADYPICPYVDWVQYAFKDADGYLALTKSREDADYCVQVTGGCACSAEPDEEEERGERWCHSCDNGYDEDHDGNFDINDEWVCEDCCERYYIYSTVSSGGDERYVYNDDVIQVGGNYYWNNETLLKRLGFVFSEGDSEWLDPEDDYSIYLMYENDWTAQACVKDWQDNYVIKYSACHVQDHPKYGDCWFDRRHPPEGVVRHPDGIWTLATKEPA